MAQQRTLIGTGGEFPATLQGIMDALQGTGTTPRRWLVFTDSLVELSGTIDLDTLGDRGGFLRLDSALATGTTIRRTGDFSLLRALSGEPAGSDPGQPAAARTWHLYTTGVSFDGGGTGTAPVCELCVVDRCHFQNSAWRNGLGDGLVLGHDGPPVPNSGWIKTGDGTVLCVEAYQASTSAFYSCDFSGNGGYGLRLLNAIDFTIADSTAENNAGGGIYWQGPGPQDCTGAAREPKGIGTIKDVSLLGSGGYGLWLDVVDAVRVAQCEFDRNLRLGSGSRWCIVETNKFHMNSAIEDLGLENVKRNNSFLAD